MRGPSSRLLGQKNFTCEISTPLTTNACLFLLPQEGRFSTVLFFLPKNFTCEIFLTPTKYAKILLISPKGP